MRIPALHMDTGYGCNGGRCPPQELESAQGTVYTIRLTTSYDRGSALSEPNTAVNVCLISKGGSSLIHRVAAVNDPDQSKHDLEHICSVSDACTPSCDISALVLLHASQLFQLLDAPYCQQPTAA